MDREEHIMVMLVGSGWWQMVVGLVGLEPWQFKKPFPLLLLLQVAKA